MSAFLIFIGKQKHLLVLVNPYFTNVADAYSMISFVNIKKAYI